MAIGAIALALGVGCDSRESEPVQADAKAQGNAVAAADVSGKAAASGDVAMNADIDAALAVKPRIGGTLVAAGDYQVELLAFVDGRIEAVVMDAKGELVAAADKLSLTATLAAKGDAKAKVDLAWDAKLARFVGHVAAGVELVPGPVEVSLDVDGKVAAGALAELGLAAHASHGGQIAMAGAYSIEVVADGGFVHAYAFDASGKAHAAGNLDIDLDVDGASRLDLVWDPPSASYKAELAAGLDLQAKPIVVRIAADGKAAFAAVASFHSSAKLAAGGDAKLRADVHAHAPSASAKADAGAHAGGSTKAGAKIDVHEHAEASGKAGGDAGAKIGGEIKGGVKIGGGAKGGVKIGG